MLCTLNALFKSERYKPTVPIIPCLQLVFFSNQAAFSSVSAAAITWGLKFGTGTVYYKHTDWWTHTHIHTHSI